MFSRYECSAVNNQPVLWLWIHCWCCATWWKCLSFLLFHWHLCILQRERKHREKKKKGGNNKRNSLIAFNPLQISMATSTCNPSCCKPFCFPLFHIMLIIMFLRPPGQSDFCHFVADVVASSKCQPADLSVWKESKDWYDVFGFPALTNAPATGHTEQNRYCW